MNLFINILFFCSIAYIYMNYCMLIGILNYNKQKKQFKREIGISIDRFIAAIILEDGIGAQLDLNGSMQILLDTF